MNIPQRTRTLKITSPGPLPRLERRALIEAMEKAHSGFVQAIEGLTPREAGKAGVTRLWSLKDLLAHLVGWQHEALKRVPEMVAGARDKSYDIPKMNRKFVENLKEMPWGLLLRDLGNLHSALVGMAREADEKHLDPRSPVYEWLYNVGCEHYREHTEGVRKWVGQLKTQRQIKEESP